MDRTAVITGATGLLGKEITFCLFKNSYNVVINYFRSEDVAKDMAKTIGETALLVKADISKSNDVMEMAELVYRRFGNIDVLINNAAIARDSLLLKFKEVDWDEIISINLKGAFNCIKAFAPIMKDGGHIINISSYSGLKGKEGQVAYSSSKAALIGLTKSLAREFANRNIKVNAITPGYMPSKMGTSAEKAMLKAKEESLLKTLSDPQEVSRFIIYLIGTKNITGQVFCLDSRII